MKKRVEERRPIRMRDPLFAELFRHADKIQLKYEKTPKGVRVVETSQDAHVVALIQAHGGVVSLFVKNGFEEARKDHAVPGTKTTGSATTGNPATAAGAACPLSAAGGCRAAAGGGGCAGGCAGCPAAGAAACPRQGLSGRGCVLGLPSCAGRGGGQSVCGLPQCGGLRRAKDCPAGAACSACPAAQAAAASKACRGLPQGGDLHRQRSCPLNGSDVGAAAAGEAREAGETGEEECQMIVRIRMGVRPWKCSS